LSGSPLLCGDVVADVLLKDNREGNPDEPAGRGLNKGSNLESDSGSVDSMTSFKLFLLSLKPTFSIDDPEKENLSLLGISKPEESCLLTEAGLLEATASFDNFGLDLISPSTLLGLGGSEDITEDSPAVDNLGSWRKFGGLEKI